MNVPEDEVEGFRGLVFGGGFDDDDEGERKEDISRSERFCGGSDGSRQERLNSRRQYNESRRKAGVVMCNVIRIL